MLSARIALVIALAAALAACGKAKTAAVEDSRTPVEVISVGAAHDLGAVRASGLVGYKRETILSFDAPGVIASLHADEGDFVKAGQRLATLRRTTVGSNATEAALARETAERQLARTQALYDKGFVAQAALDDAKLAVERARDSAVLTAPSAGVILRRQAEPAQMVNAGQPVLMLGEVNSGIIVRAAVPSQSASRIRTGDKATVTIGADAPRAGKVTRIAAKSDDMTGAFEVEVHLASAKGLRSGQVAEVDIAGYAAPNAQAAIVIPALSLLDARADQGVVFVVDQQGIARRRSVQTAGLTPSGVVIVSGLTPGDRIIAAGAAYVREGETVLLAGQS